MMFVQHCIIIIIVLSIYARVCEADHEHVSLSLPHALLHVACGVGTAGVEGVMSSDSGRKHVTLGTELVGNTSNN